MTKRCVGSGCAGLIKKLKSPVGQFEFGSEHGQAGNQTFLPSARISLITA